MRSRDNKHTHRYESSKWKRTDPFLTLVLVAFAALLRFWNLAHLGLTHFDEGSYTMAGRWLATWGETGWFIEAGHSPPLFPLLVGLSFLVFGVSDTIAIGVSAALGAATVGGIYVVGKVWFSRTVGILAALFLATCEYHLVYSRLALTDSTFVLLFWASLGTLWWGISKTDRRHMILAGLLTGLCWNTKYHGFFPWVIAAAWLLLKSGLGTSAGQRRLLTPQQRQLLGTGGWPFFVFSPGPPLSSQAWVTGLFSGVSSITR